MKILTKTFRLIVTAEGVANADCLEEQTGTTTVPADAAAHEFDTQAELVAYAQKNYADAEVKPWEPEIVVAVPAVPTLADYERTVEEVLQEVATAHHYDDIVSASSYAAVPNPFQEESAALLAWRGNVWAWCYALMADPPNVMPTLSEFRAALLEANPAPTVTA